MDPEFFDVRAAIHVPELVEFPGAFQFHGFEVGQVVALHAATTIEDKLLNARNVAWVSWCRGSCAYTFSFSIEIVLLQSGLECELKAVEIEIGIGCLGVTSSVSK